MQASLSSPVVLSLLLVLSIAIALLVGWLIARESTSSSDSTTGEAQGACISQVPSRHRCDGAASRS